MDDRSWKDLVDISVLSDWMDHQGLGRGEISNILPLTGGTQNVMIAFHKGARRYVLRRPPRHPRANGNETMRREMRVLNALASTDVPHPPLIAACPEEGVLGTAFYLMEPIDGFNVTTGMPPLHSSDPSIRRGMGFALIDGLLKLGRVDYEAVGLQDFGKVDGFLERQVGRWRKQLESYNDYKGWPGPDTLPAIEKLAGWLEQNKPSQFKPGIMHGDYHLANVMYRNDGPELAAIVDWELSTIGDPLLDLGWVLTTWPRPNEETSMKIEPWDGFPSAEELLAAYSKESDRDTSGITWYLALACFKLGILLEGTYARSCAGKAAKDVGEKFHARTITLLQRAERLVT